MDFNSTLYDKIRQTVYEDADFVVAQLRGYSDIDNKFLNPPNTFDYNA
jgi:hypothetical protein